MGETFLVAIDGSKMEKRVIEFALKEAKLKEANLVFLRIMEIPTYVTEIEGCGRLLKKVKHEITADLTEKTEQAKQMGLVADFHFDYSGEHKKAIVSYIQNYPTPIDWIIIGTTGQSNRSADLGSTVDYVVHHAPCNVTIVQ